MYLLHVVERYLDAVSFTEDDQLGDDDCIGFHPSMWTEAENDCQAFMDALEEAGVEYEDIPIGDFAIDFWLTRNRHGTGFWDDYKGKKYGGRGDALTEVAHSMGERDVYLADDGYAYFA